ncbi:universal stress protein [Spirilliplanes yamanashiensis]|uniref:Universal stress protein n=1 Tax=Spirilliplanes yamanashiensis TaxID=42233 RepID=A0A8J3YEW7_9ACTN|nr:universal stress protein [Spirilliplanes yamanashiensis]MDP9818251.1 nucleotide-binding universal stress UspA family protein [Spirilliplanes yamanashiensis]GIJ06669.1 universal stress protein [Spirilliplanes yamanashiensis]
MTTNEIVVATDGSEPGTAAVAWAAREAHRTSSVLHVVHAYEWDWPGARFDGAREFQSMADAAAEQVLADALLTAHAVDPGLPVRHTADIGAPVRVILDASARARLLVVGSRGRGGFASLLLGSVGHRIAVHATCPVVVVRGRAADEDGPVVVGADGSQAGADAVELAFAAAASRGAELVAVRAYTPPVPPWGPDMPPLVYDPAEREAEERAALEDQLRPWRGKYPQVPVEALVTKHDAARVLVGVSHTARLVVVGDRGFGVVTGTVLGSVTSQVLHHADCPVLVARG